ncbi:hypothetical protein AA309_30555 [Microvirga vignae]|uniref:Uroporphyrinogen-III synthase n=1 Tax=Microvirga vignae TaxID=1225564 RepID=A0A0H1R425_9HYPH|nr:hypothetical protein [Microvirga vignae]KLK89571.1 hypothetical protein AA309_30555 [Microvirga vignae]
MRVLLTRPQAQSKEPGAVLEGQGIEWLGEPLLRIVPVPWDPGVLSGKLRATRRGSGFRWTPIMLLLGKLPEHGLPTSSSCLTPPLVMCKPASPVIAEAAVPGSDGAG